LEIDPGTDEELEFIGLCMVHGLAIRHEEFTLRFYNSNAAAEADHYRDLMRP
jgi:hypothetical protein